MKHFSFLSIGCLLFLCSACHPVKYQYNEGEIFHTSYHIRYACANDLHKEIHDCLNHFDASLSMFHPGSTIQKINAAGADEAVYIGDDPWMMYVLTKSMEISQITDGAFDITIAPLVNLWGFGLKKKESVTDLQVEEIKTYVGYHKILLKDSCVIKKDARTQLDASAIAKGYACDVIAEYLQEQNVYDYMVEIGGEIRMAGLNDRHQAWMIGIDKPKDDSLALERQLQVKIQLSDKAIATSGNYRNFYRKDGMKIAHTIDPHSGHPVQHSLLSATVIAEDCLTADAFATSFMVMGLEKAIHITDSLPYLSSYFIYSDESGNLQTWSSSELKSHLIP